MPALTHELILAELNDGQETHPSVLVTGNVVSLFYRSHETYAARTSEDIETLRMLPGFDLAESWAPAPGKHDFPAVHVRLVAKPLAKPVAPVKSEKSGK